MVRTKAISSIFLSGFISDARATLGSITISSILSSGFFSGAPAIAQERTGTSFGVPNSSPCVMWPRLMGIDVIQPGALYPNGNEFGLGTTAGGFGSSGTGALSGVGLERRSLGGLEAAESANRFSYQQRLAESFASENLRGNSVFSAPVSSRLSRQFGNQFTPPSSAGALIPSSDFPGVDKVLNDRPPDTDTILQTNLR